MITTVCDLYVIFIRFGNEKSKKIFKKSFFNNNTGCLHKKRKAGVVLSLI